MRILLVAYALIAATPEICAFAPNRSFNSWGSTSSLTSTSDVVNYSAEIKSKIEYQNEKLKKKDATSSKLSKQDLKVIYEDEYIVVVDKPAGVLCVPGKDNNPSLSQAVFDAFGCESRRADKMVVHRLGMDTSGLVIFARTDLALRRLNAQFRKRQVTRKYEALVCGHIEKDKGTIDMPLMRDYEKPPYMRISTDEHQKVLMQLDAEKVGKKLLENPKDSLTKYEVVSREKLDGNDVTRLSLTSITGRTHQLNVHCAAFGHPIVGDKIYGFNGEACPNGGLDTPTSPSSASIELQEAIASFVGEKPMCVHAKTIHFRHPKKDEFLTFDSDASF